MSDMAGLAADSARSLMTQGGIRDTAHSITSLGAGEPRIVILSWNLPADSSFGTVVGHLAGSIIKPGR
jgi:hypothetical protein